MSLNILPSPNLLLNATFVLLGFILGSGGFGLQATATFDLDNHLFNLFVIFHIQLKT